MEQQRKANATERLEQKFGSEYGRAVDGAGRKKGEAELQEREQRVEGFNLRTLGADESQRFNERWTATQTRFVDDPGGAIADADSLLGEAMQARGYPVADFEQRAADVSVDHADFVENYRMAHEKALSHSAGEASTEDLRQAMVHYRWLFSDLVAPGPQTDRAAVPA
jgi:hypothetical protein